MLVVLCFVVASRLLVLYECSRLVELQCDSVLIGKLVYMLAKLVLCDSC